MAFVSPPPQSPAGPLILQNDGWFPDIDLGRLRLVARLDPNVTAERLREAAVDAVSTANSQLAVWKAARVAEGRESLTAVPAASIGGESAKVAQYLRAVHAYCSADLHARLRDIGATPAGHDRADELEDAEAGLRRTAAWAIADLQDKRRTVVELI